MDNKGKIKILKEYVNQVKEYAELIEFYNQKKYSLPAKVITDMPTSRGSATSRIEANHIQFETMCEIVRNKASDIQIKCTKIETIICNVNDSNHRRLLRMRYLQDYTFEKISVEMNYSWRQIHRLHSDALKNVNMS